MIVLENRRLQLVNEIFDKEQLYLKMSMLDCTTCANYKKECEPKNNVFKCHYLLKTHGIEER